MEDDDFLWRHIDSYLESSISVFEYEVRRRYADEAHAQSVWEASANFAEALTHQAESLVKSDGKAWQSLREVLGEHSLGRDIQYALECHLAWKLMPSFSDAATRCWQLAELSQRASPSPQVQRFIGRLARCFLLGLEPECLVMCRGTFENALNSRYLTEGIPFPTDSNGRVSGMKRRIMDAESRGWLPEGSAQDLYIKVWERGSKAAHADPEAVGGALETISLTARALAYLAPPPSLEPGEAEAT